MGGAREVKMPARSAQETARLGKEVYVRGIRHLVETDHQGEVIAIDVGGGSHSLGKKAISASESLLEPTSGRPSLPQDKRAGL